MGMIVDLQWLLQPLLNIGAPPLLRLPCHPIMASWKKQRKAGQLYYMNEKGLLPTKETQEQTSKYLLI